VCLDPGARIANMKTAQPRGRAASSGVFRWSGEEVVEAGPAVARAWPPRRPSRGVPFRQAQRRKKQKPRWLRRPGSRRPQRVAPTRPSHPGQQIRHRGGDAPPPASAGWRGPRSPPLKMQWPGPQSRKPGKTQRTGGGRGQTCEPPARLSHAGAVQVGQICVRPFADLFVRGGSG
jgi:hypothetical protein